MRKPFDMADKYEPLSYTDPDSEPTVKIHMPNFLPKVIVEDDDEPTLPSMRNPLFPEEKRYPGVGLLIALSLSAALWFLPAYYLVVYYIFR